MPAPTGERHGDGRLIERIGDGRVLDVAQGQLVGERFGSGRVTP
jgi:hypothetical protein